MEGVVSKMHTLANYLQSIKTNSEYDVVCLNYEKNGLIDGVCYKRVNASRLVRGFFRYSVLDSNLDLAQYNKIIIRYMDADLSAKSFFKKYANKLITEHHSIAISEITSSRRPVDLIKFFMEKFFSPMKYAKSIVAVTEEILTYEKKRSKNLLRSAVVTNGVAVGNIEPSIKKAIVDHINLIFVSSNFACWQGLDRLIASLKLYTGKLYINLHLVGELNSTQIKDLHNFRSVKVKIIIHGVLKGHDLDSVYNIAHFGIGPLCLYRKSLISACPLKIREYFFRGIPFLYAYDDDDFTSDLPYVYKIENNSEVFDVETVLHSLFLCMADRDYNYADEMKLFCDRSLTWDSKFNQLLMFVEGQHESIL